MRKPLATVAVAIVLTATACGSDDNPPASAPSTGAPTSAAAGSTLKVTGLANLKFDPASLSATKGTAYTIELHQAGSIPHTFTVKDFAINLTSSKEGEVKTAPFTPDKAGSFKYTCTFHPDMTGTLTVT